jgi:hypothetical protein
VEEEEEEINESTGPRKFIPPKVSAAALIMRAETHPWLKWPGCDSNRKIVLNNRLAEIQNRPIYPPKFMEGELLSKLGLNERLSGMFLTRNVHEGKALEIPIWTRAVNIKEKVYREWCCEFYSSLEVEKKFKDHEFEVKKLISFRLGGKEHKVSVSQFGFLTGLLTREESQRKNISWYLSAGKQSSREFAKEADRAWLKLSGLQKHTSVSKVSAIRVPLLRLVHKLLTYSFIHRVTQHDKCYLEDLWLLDTLHQGDPKVYVCVPWVLVCFMEARGAGRHKDSQICCGHFVTRIVRNLGLFTPASVKACSPPVDFKSLTIHDLEASRLVNKAGTALIEAGIGSAQEGDREEEQVPIRKSKGIQELLLDEMRKTRKAVEGLKKSVDRMEDRAECSVAHYAYHMERYQPYIEEIAAARAAALGTPLPLYAPPELYVSSEEEDADAAHD